MNKDTIEGMNFPPNILQIFTLIGEFADKQNVKACVVGGFVRDMLLQKANYDIDIVIEGDAIPFAQSLSKELNTDCHVFDKFHTAKICINGLDVDFASARKEIYEYVGALPTVTLNATAKDDLFRRDFTINALALALNGENRFQIIDYFNGLDDLKNGLIRVMHEKSFEDDPTRLYRAVRFAHRFNFRMEPTTWQLYKQAIKAKVALRISIKRVAAELTKIFQEKHPGKIINQLKRAKLLSHFPCNIELRDLNYDCLKLKEAPDVATVYWICFLSFLQFNIRNSIIANMGLPHSMRLKIDDGLDALKKIPKQLLDLHCEDHIRLFDLLEKRCPEALAALVSFSLNKENINKVVYYTKHLMGIKPEITGKDLIDEGIEAGPHIRTILEYITELKLDGRCLTKQEELEIGKSIYKNIRS